MENFDLVKINRMFSNIGDIESKTDKAKLLTKCCEYISETIKPLEDGRHFIIRDDENTIIEDTIFTKTILRKLPKPLQSFYSFERNDLHKLVCEPNMGFLYKNRINLFPKMKHQNKQYDDYDNEIKIKVNTFIAFMKEVLCSGSDEVLQYLLKWYSNVVKCVKNDSALYLRSFEEGIGKSTMTEFIMKHVLGHKLTIQADSNLLLTGYNKSLLSKVLVVFEEMPTFSKGQWDGVSSTLKTMITSDRLIFNEKFEKGMELRNTNNYVINTNSSAIAHDDGRRYFILDLSTSRKGDHVYFSKLRKDCFNDEVGEAFYNYLLTIDTTKFYAQDFPMTEAKKNAKVERLHSVYQYVKEEKILKNTVLCGRLTVIYDKYVEFCEKKEIIGRNQD